MIWKDEYKIGIPQIDTQHEELFGRISDFVDTVRTEGEWLEKIEKVKKTMEYMKDYVVIHFRDEEAYHETIGYPEALEHVELHREMVEYIENMEQRLEQEAYKEIILQQFAGKLVTWLINHVLSDDQKVVAYAKEKGIE